MDGMQWLLDAALAALLAATLFHAVRLERALGVLKRDRSALQDMVEAFNASTRHAEASVGRLQAAADGAGRQLAQQAEAAILLKDDLAFLTERGARLADSLDGLVRMARPLLADAPRPRALAPEPRAEPRSEPRSEPREAMAEARTAETRGAAEPDKSRTRSQAERDLIKALKLSK
jgi:hypothetical protein